MINFKICHVGRIVPPVFVDSTGIVTNGLVAQFDGKHNINTVQDKNSTTWYALAGKMILQLKITKTQSCSFYQRDWVFSACWYQYLSFYLMTHFRLSNRFYQTGCFYTTEFGTIKAWISASQLRLLFALLSYQVKRKIRKRIRIFVGLNCNIK